MVNRELVNYILSNIRRGVSYDDIQAALLARGHSDYDITEAVNFINGAGASKQSHIEKKAVRREVSNRVKYFLLGFFSLVLLIVVLLVMIPVLKDSQKNVVTISEGTLKQGKSFDLTKNNLVQFNFGGKNYNFTVKSGGSDLLFSGPVRFTLNQGEVKMLDIDEDGGFDYSISYSPLVERRIFIQAICVESWKCEDWNNCFAGTQQRICVDSNECGTTGSRPLLVQSCEDNSDSSSSNVILPIIDSGNNLKENSGNTETSGEANLIVTTILSCGSDLEYNSNNYCTGEVRTVSNSTTSIECCHGQIVDVLEMSDTEKSVWDLLSSSGNCSGDLFDALFECSEHKCLSEDGTLYRGVIGMFSGYCSYYEELPNNEKLYCEYNENDRKNVVGYYFSESAANEVVHNSTGTYLDGVQRRNYAQEAIESGICQVL